MKIIILGDSISEGIGSKKLNYSSDLKKKLIDEKVECEVINMALSGTTIKYGVSLLPDILKKNPDFVIVMYGNVDAQIRPNVDRNRFHIKDLTPKHYKNIGGMLDPRALYSRKKSRFLLQVLDNFYRKIWKKIIVKTQGTYQKIRINEFEKNYKVLLKHLSENNINTICASTVFIDDKYFLNSSKEYKKYNKTINKVANKYNYEYIDIYLLLKKKLKN